MQLLGTDRSTVSVAQSVSFRDAMFHRMMAGRPGFRLAEVMCDVVHTNALGHRRVCPSQVGLSLSVSARMVRAMPGCSDMFTVPWAAMPNSCACCVKSLAC